MKKKGDIDLEKREFMEGGWRLLNVGAFLTLGGFLAGLPLLSMSSGHPEAIWCYECRACASTCPWRFDPSGFEVAARTNNPDRRMLFQAPLDPDNPNNYNNVVAKGSEKEITLKTLIKRDPLIKVKVEVNGEESIMTVEETQRYYPDDIKLVSTYEMRAKDAAFYCPLCAKCEPPCPVGLPITEIIRDLKNNSVFG